MLVERSLDRVPDSGIVRSVRAVDPDPPAERPSPLPTGLVHHAENLGEGGAGVAVERLAAVSHDGCGEPRHLGVGEVDRWQRRRGVDGVAATWTGLGRHRKPALLQRGDVALDGADTDLEECGEPVRGAPGRTSTTQLLTHGVETIGPVHAEIVTYR